MRNPIKGIVMSKYFVLPPDLVLRGWSDVKHALQSKTSGEVTALPQHAFDAILLSANGIPLDSPVMFSLHREFLEKLLKNGVGKQSDAPAELTEDQQLRTADCLFARSIHWSITGRCNMKCRHCFIEAPDALYGELSLEQCTKIMDQMLDANILQISITGGEPLVRPDWKEFYQELKKRGICVTAIYTNGLLVTDQWLDRFAELEPNKIAFSLSFDGIGYHDWVRGRDGMEQRTIDAIRLLRKRGYPVSIESSLYKDNLKSMPATCQLLADLGIKGWKLSGMAKNGAWLKYAEKTATDEELYDCFLSILKKFTELKRPFSLQMEQCYYYDKDTDTASDVCCRTCTDTALNVPVCSSIRLHPYLLPDGTLMPCMPLSNCGIDRKMPNLLEIPLTQALKPGSALFELSSMTVAEMFQKHPSKCTDCQYRFKCRGGCRARAYSVGDLFGPDTKFCRYFESGYEKLFEPYLDKKP